MVKKTKNRHIFLIIVGIILTLFVLNWFGVFDNIAPNSLFSFVAITNWTEVIGDSFTCNSPDGCNVKAFLECSQSSYTQKIIFRTNSVDSNNYDDEGVWIAVNVIPYGNSLQETSDLNGYCSTSTIGGSEQDSNYETVDGNKIFGYSGKIYVIVNGHNRLYESCTLTPEKLSLEPTEPYTSNGQEMKSQGYETAYTCGGIFHYGSNQVNLGNQRSIPWNSTTVGGDTTKINNQESAYFENTGTYGVGHIFTRDLQQRLDCAVGNKPKCSQSGDVNGDHTGYYDCINSNGNYYLDSIFHSCDLDKGEVCLDSIGNCSFPLTYDLYFTNIESTSGTHRTGFDPAEKIFIQYKVKSSQISNANIGFIICPYQSSFDSSECSSYDLGNQLLSINSFKTFEILNPGAGYIGQQFYVVIAVTYNGKTQYIGKDYKDYSFRIAPGISCNAQFMSNIGSGTQSLLYKGLPATLSIYTTISQSPLPVDSFSKFSINLDTGNGIIPIDINPQTPDSIGPGESAYVYSYNFIPQSTGMLDGDIQVSKSGIVQDCVVSSRTVNPISVKPKFTDLDKYVNSCTKPGVPLTLHIDIKDSIGNYVDIVPTLKVVRFNQTIQEDISDSLNCENGKCEFTYTPDSNFYLQISSSLFASTNTGTIEVLSNCNSDNYCSSDNDCSSLGYNSRCINNTCESPQPSWLIYIGVGIAVLVVLIIVIIFLKRRNKKQEVYTGLENL